MDVGIKNVPAGSELLHEDCRQFPACFQNLEPGSDGQSVTVGDDSLGRDDVEKTSTHENYPG